MYINKRNQNAPVTWSAIPEFRHQVKLCAAAPVTIRFHSRLSLLFFLLGIRFETLPTRVCCRAGREVQVFRVAAPRASSSWLWFSVSLCQVSITRGYFAKRLPHQTGFFFHSSVSFPDQIPHVPRRCFAANGVELPGRGECDFAEQNPYSSAWSQALVNN